MFKTIFNKFSGRIVLAIILFIAFVYFIVKYVKSKRYMPMKGDEDQSKDLIVMTTPSGSLGVKRPMLRGG